MDFFWTRVVRRGLRKLFRNHLLGLKLFAACWLWCQVLITKSTNWSRFNYYYITSDWGWLILILLAAICSSRTGVVPLFVSLYVCSFLYTYGALKFYEGTQGTISHEKWAWYHNKLGAELGQGQNHEKTMRIPPLNVTKYGSNLYDRSMFYL